MARAAGPQVPPKASTEKLVRFSIGSPRSDALERRVTRVKSEQSSKESMQTSTRLLPGEGRADREAIDASACLLCRGIGHGTSEG
jgi:hypothetical protein